MASELKVNTLKDAAGNNSVAMTYVANGSAKAWGNTSADGTTIDDSFNIASLTDTGTGQQQPFFTSSMSNAHYAVELNVTSNINQNWCQNIATGSFVSKSYTGSAFEDREHLTTVHGDLA